jgi:hypothetical protein
VSVPNHNYNGASFAEALQIAMNTAMNTEIHFDVSYDLDDHLITIKQRDQFDAKVYLASGADLQSGKYWSNGIPKGMIQSINGVLRIGKGTYQIQQDFPHIACIDSHTTRNLFITSSSLASYNILFNFGNDVIIKKVAVKANYSHMLFDTAEVGELLTESILDYKTLTGILWILETTTGRSLSFFKNIRKSTNLL